MKPQTLQKIYTCLCCIVAIQCLFVSSFLMQNTVSVAPLAATCLLIFNNPATRVSQPLSIFGSYFVLGLLGSLCHYLMPCNAYFQMCFLLCASILMICSSLNHPPALAFLFLITNDKSNYFYDFWIALSQLLFVLAISGLLINLVLKIKYPNSNGEDR